MQILGKIILIFKNDEFYIRYRLRIRVILIISMLFYILFVSYEFYTAHGSYLKLVIIKEEITRDNLQYSLIALEKLLRSIFKYFPIKAHVLFLISFLLALYVDRVCALFLLFFYVSLCLLIGLHIELISLIKQAVPSLFCGIWIRIDIVYSDEYMINFAYNFLILFNTEFGTDYPIDSELLAEWILLSGGNPSVLLDILIRVYSEYHRINLLLNKRMRPQNLLINLVTGLLSELQRWWEDLYK